VKICLVCSHGGHFVEMLRLRSAFEGHDVFWISHDGYMTRELRDHLGLNAYLIPVRFKRSSLLADMWDIARAEFRVFFREKPDLVVTTGSEICIPMCCLAKVYGKKSVFVESLCRVNSLSATGRIMYPIVDLFLVQWPDLANRYRKARYEGRII
jgi:beta-1,4-N-acetylglucosaminyltransferase